MDGSGRAPPYEDDITLPEYDNEILYMELVDAVGKKDLESVRCHIETTNNLIDMETLPAYLMIKYCIIVAALLTPKDWEFSQRAQCVAEARWRTMFEYACDHGDREAYIPLITLRTYLNRLESMRIKCRVPFYKLDEDNLRVDGIYDFEENDEPPRYTIEDMDAPPTYADMYESLQRIVRSRRAQLVTKRKRACSTEAAIVSTKKMALRSGGRLQA